MLEKKKPVGPRSTPVFVVSSTRYSHLAVLPAYLTAIRKPRLWASAIFSMIYTGRYVHCSTLQSDV